MSDEKKNGFNDFLEAAKPMIKWISENCHPHCSVIIDCNSAELFESVAIQKTDEFVKD